MKKNYVHGMVGLFMMAFLAAPASWAGEVSLSVPFQLDEWVSVEKADGSVTVHRVRVKNQKSNVKSRLLRPGRNSSYTQTVVVEIEYSNTATRDVECEVDVSWLDSQGREIDGHEGEEDFDDEENHEITTMTFSTLKYGVEVARKLSVNLSW